MTTIVSAVLAGIGVLLAGNLPWVALLAPLNLRLLPVVPWAIAPMAIYLVLYWRYIGGRIGSSGTAEMRRARLRANRLAPDVWSWRSSPAWLVSARCWRWWPPWRGW